MESAVNDPTILDFDLNSMIEWGFCLFFFEERMSVYKKKMGGGEGTWCIDQLENISSLSYAAFAKKNVDKFPYTSSPISSDKPLSIEKLLSAHWQNKFLQILIFTWKLKFIMDNK